MSVPENDRGLTLGDGLFETVLCRDGQPAFWAAHVERLRRGCEVLGLPAPTPAELAAALADAAPGPGRTALRLTWTAGSGGRGLDRPASPAPRLFVAVAPAPPSPGPARLATSTVRRNASSPASRLKTLAYLDSVLARREARDAGAEEAVMLNTRGEIACAAAANLFWLRDGVLFTPALDCGVLDGIMRRAVLDAATDLGVEAREVRAGPTALAGAAVFLTNSLIGLRPAASLDGGDLSQCADLISSLLGAVDHRTPWGV